MGSAHPSLLVGFEPEAVLYVVAAVVIAATLVGGVRALIRAAESEHRRRDRLARLAESLGCSFTGQTQGADVQSFKPFTWFIQGGDPYLLNTFDCTIITRYGRAHVRMGDFRTVTRVETRSGQVEQFSEFSYLLADLPFDAGGRLLARPQGMFDTIAAVFGGEDIDFESASFNRRFRVQASSKRFAYDVLHPAILDRLLTTEPFPLLIDGPRCCISDKSSRWTAELFRSKLDWMQGFLDALPAHVAEKGD